MMEGTFCVVCTTKIPDDREKRRAVTCSDICKKTLADRRRHRNEGKVCVFCKRPSTPEERVLFARWRREAFPQPKKGRPSKKPDADATSITTSEAESKE